MIRKRIATIGLAAIGLLATALWRSETLGEQRVHALRELIPLQLTLQPSPTASPTVAALLVEEDIWSEDRQRALLSALPRNCSVFIKQLREYAAWRAGALKKLVATGGDLHAPETEGLKAVVVSSTGGGFGDRLPFMISVLAFCMRYKRVFFIDWQPFAKFVYSPFLDWRLRHDLYPKLAQRVAQTPVKLLYTCENDGEDGHNSCIWARGKPNETLDRDLLHIAGNRGVWSAGSNRPHMNWYRDEIIDGVLACPHQAIAQPRPALVARAKPMLDRFAALRAADAALKLVGFHYRAGDGILLANKGFTVDDMSNGWREQLKLCAASSNYTIFLLSDSAQLRADAVRRFGPERIITTDLVPRHVGDVEVRNTKVNETEAVADVLTDWWLLKHCDFIVVGKMDSGFSRMAVVASKHASIVYSQVMIGESVGHCRANDVSRTGRWPKCS